MSENKVKDMPFAVSYSMDDKAVYDYNYMNHYVKEENLYKTYKDLYTGNMFSWFFVNHLADLITGQIVYRDESGKDLKKLMRLFDRKHKFTKNLSQAIKQAIIYGNGFYFVDRKTKVFKRIDAENVKIHRDKKGVVYYEILDENSDSTKSTIPGKETKNIVEDFKKKTNVLKEENIKHLTFFDVPETPYGISLLRPNVQDFRALKELSRYSYSGIAHLSCVDRYMALDLEGLKDEEAKEAMDTAMESFKQLVTSTQTITFFDKNNEIYYGGTKNGGATQRIQPFRDIIETPLGVLMSQFCMSMGFLLPSGANKSIIQETEKKLRYTIKSMRERLELFIEDILYEVFPDLNFITVTITDPDTDPVVSRTFAQKDVELNVISIKEYRELYYPSLKPDSPKDDLYEGATTGKLGFEGYKAPTAGKGDNNHSDGEE